MSLFIKLFERTQEYSSYIASDDKVLPNVSLCEDTKNVYFNPYVPHDYSQDYFTMVVTASGNIIWSGSTTDNSLSYSKNNGSTWTTVNSTDTISVNSGETILWKGTPMPQSIKGIGKFSGDTNVRYSVEGNVMSLLFGDDFKGQTSLSGKDFALYNLFNGSTNVTSAENLSLPATTLADSCYRTMFRNSNLRTAPQLPTATLVDKCYYSMFYGCTNLTTVPSTIGDSSTVMAASACTYMFGGCTSLTTAPELPATILANNCYESMFQGCTSLTTTPQLLATTLTDGCYHSMFQGCTSLTTAPQLPATTLATSCYNNMFANCTSLTTAPELPATTLANECYAMMFQGCTSLTEAPELPATTLADGCYRLMFAFTNVILDCSNIDFTSPTVVASGTLKGLFAYTKITSSQLDAILKAHGINNYSLPVMTLTDSCYQSMFYNCTSLTRAPELPATTLANNCYNQMFYGCTSLTTVPSTIGDSSTVMAASACTFMFSGCTSLTTASQLPSTSLATRCYYAMFDGCTRLRTAPQLPATTLANECYGSMFSGCRNLNSITCLATDISATRCTNHWLNGVAASGTFTKAASMNDWTEGNNGIPSGWTVQDAA